MLAIDIGNTRVKWALFSGGSIQSHGAFSYSQTRFESDLNESNLPNCATALNVSCVAGESIKECIIDWCNKRLYTTLSFAKTESQQCGIINSYKTVSNMGIDRWLAMIAAFNLNDLKQDELICVIDCGTAITLDVLDIKGKHLGGLIVPGYQSMLKSLFNNANEISKQSTVRESDVFERGVFSSTKEAITKGCEQLIVAGLSGIIRDYQQKTDKTLRCMVTGGDGEWVFKRLDKDGCFDPFLVLHGLDIISKNNEKNK